MLLLSDLLDIAISVGSSVSVEAHWDQETGIIQSDQGHYPLTSDEHHVMITGHHEHHVMITGHHDEDHPTCSRGQCSLGSATK